MSELQSKSQLAMFDLIKEISKSNSESHLTEAQIDLTQAQTVKTLAEAGVTASETLMNEAENAESGGEETGNIDPSTIPVAGVESDTTIPTGP